ncbi:MAG: hypothetical protein AAB214_01510, partial [Fibrobacterota bacterium]
VIGVRSPIVVQGKLTTSEGVNWRSAIFDLTSPGEYLRVSISQLQYTRSIGPGGEVWTEANHLDSYWSPFDTPKGWLIRGEDTDTSHSVLETSINLHSRSRGDLLAIGSMHIFPEDPGYRSSFFEIALVSPDNPIYRQKLDVPEAIFDFCFWQGNLVMLSEKHLYFAHITKPR